MLCKNCGKINEEGKFCESCGTKLEGDSIEEVASTTEAPVEQNTQSSHTASETNVNEYLDKAKHISKTYFSYFVKILKSPLSESQNIRKEEFVNGVITIALYALLIPLMVYLSLGSDRQYLHSPFLNVLLKPTIGYAVFIFLIAGFSFLAVQLGRVKVDIKDVISRFGALLVPFVAFFALGFILALLQIELFAIALSLGLMGGIMAVPPLVIQSFKKNVSGGLDAVYGIILTYILIGITLGVMSAILIDNIIGNFGGFLNLPF